MRSQQTFDSFVWQSANLIALIRTEAVAEKDLLRSQIASEDKSGNHGASLLRKKYGEQMSNIKVVIQTV